VSWPTELELDVLAELGREVADEARKRRKTASTGIMRTCMTIACRACEQRVRSAPWRGTRPRHLGLGEAALDLGAQYTTLAHEVHELVQALGVDADGRGRARRPSRARGHADTARGRPALRPRRPAGAASATSAAATSGTAAAARERGGLDLGGDPDVDDAAVEGLDVVASGAEATTSPSSAARR
jgi:hypothetical protein